MPSLLLEVAGMTLRTWWLVICTFSVLCCLTPAEAWEFKMTGEYEWRFRYLGRLGDKDLFGRMKLQDLGGPLIGLAGPNIYGRGFGSNTPFFRASNVRIVRTGFSETDPDAHYLEQRITLFPKIFVNEAIEFHSVFTIGGYRNKFDRTATGVGLPPFERNYMERTSVNGYDTAGVITVEQWITLISLPWGTISVGIKSAPIGVGATLARNTRGSALALVIPHGPLKIVPGIWAGRSRFSDG